MFFLELLSAVGCAHGDELNVALYMTMQVIILVAKGTAFPSCIVCFVSPLFRLGGSAHGSVRVSRALCVRTRMGVRTPMFSNVCWVYS